ncbi:hypothetical protein V5O48_010598 [Marasmius crinis-equi]|uniref:Aminotransferase class I/classII large domain-containing protein n=1 Tax=Marasmius crinis-equi TaxID=585013 RepID=A0ABR3F8D0_9AGAR
MDSPSQSQKSSQSQKGHTVHLSLLHRSPVLFPNDPARYTDMTSKYLSTRGVKAAESFPDDNLIWDVTSNLYDPNSNSDGYISLGVAENALMHDELRDFLNSKPVVTSTVSFTYGDGPYGSKRVAEAFAGLLNKWFRPIKRVGKEHVVVTNGVSSAIEHLAWALANPGEGIMLGRPYYRNFLPDISLRFGVEVVSVSFGEIDPIGIDAVKKYEEALKESEKKGVKVRALLLCHPHNPLGRCYSKETLVGLMTLCQKYRIHLISDEIYALSVWENKVDAVGKGLEGFESVLSIDPTGIIDPGLVHVLWGTSKDFGANGLRLGALVSQAAPELLNACKICGLYSSPSSLAENAAVELFSDEKFMEDYVRTNQERLSEAYRFAVERVKEHGIEYMTGANAAFFLWLNLGKAWKEKHPEAAEDLASTEVLFGRLMAEKVYLVRGDAAGAEEAGWFRLVFSQPREIVDEGIKRIVRALQ